MPGNQEQLSEKANLVGNELKPGGIADVTGQRQTVWKG